MRQGGRKALGLNGDEVAFMRWEGVKGQLSDRETLNGNGETLKNDEKAVKGEKGALNCDGKAVNVNMINVEG